MPNHKNLLNTLLIRKRIYEAIPIDPSYITHTELCSITKCKNPESYLRTEDPIAEAEHGKLGFMNEKAKHRTLLDLELQFNYV